MRILGNIYLILLVLIVFQASTWALSDKRLCADPNCQEIISIARASLTYTAAEKGMVSFKINSKVRVKSKSAGTDPSLWGIEVNGRQGYAPKNFLLEEKIYIGEKNLNHIVPVVVPGENPVKVPKQKLKSSEISTEATLKASESETTTILTPPISEGDVSSAILNSSEIDVEPTTTPLAEPISAEIVNQSLKETATPVLNKAQIIDGTAIPVVEDAIKHETESGRGNSDVLEKATTKNETVEKETTTKTSETSTNSKENESEVLTDTETKTNEISLEDEKALNIEASKEENNAQIKIENLISEEEKEKVAVIEQKKNSEELKVIKPQDISDSNKKNDVPNTLPDDKEKLIRNDEYFDGSDDDEGYEEDDDDDEEDTDDENDEEPTFMSSSVEVTTPEPTAPTTDSGFTLNSNLNYWEKDDVTTASPVPKREQNISDSSKEDIEQIENKPTETDTSVPKTENNVSESTPEVIENNNDQQENKLETNLTTEDSKINEVDDVSLQKDDVANNATQAIPLDSIELDKSDNEEIAKTEKPQVPTLPTTLPIIKQPNSPQKEELEIIEEQPQLQSESQQPKIQQPSYDPYQHIHQHQYQHEEKPSLPQPDQQFKYDNPNDYYRNQADFTQNQQNNVNNDTPNLEVEATITEKPTLSEEELLRQSIEIEEASKSSQEVNRNIGTGSIEMITTPAPIPVSNADISQEQKATDIPIQSVDTTQDYKPTPLLIDEKRDVGLFATILGTVNNLVTKLRKETPTDEHEALHKDSDDELNRILYPDRFSDKKTLEESDDKYCEKLSPHNCPKNKNMASSSSFESQQCHFEWHNINMDNFVDIFVAKAFEMREILSCLTIVSSTVLLFLFGYYCFCNSSREGALISKLNLLERSLLASHKENAILKDDLHKTRHKLTSIEDNSFGSNDMVMALRKELENSAEEKHQLQQQIHNLEKELEAAAEAGLELNKIVAELLNNQSGQESMIMNSVEDLQMQFNEQQKTILEINSNLAEKSRENSELQLMLAEQNVRFNGEIASLQQDNDELEAEKSNLQTRLEELKSEFEEDITKALEGKNVEIKRLQNEIVDLKNRYEDIHTKWQTSLAKIEALEDCMKTLKKDSNVNINEVINVANVRAELLDLQKQRSSLKNRLDTEVEARQHAESNLQTTITEVDKLKQDFHQSEKDKLAAQTRLEVLSNYFKEKETQLQKELSLKEAVWLKQQGENTSTVDRLTVMQDEIQSLKSQNDALRAEIEAQLAAHKAQTGTLENRAHETWLAARQSERRFEEARAEAAALRRRLTELAGAGANGVGAVDGKLSATEFNNAPSPIMPPPLLDTSAGSPLLGTLPPPPHQFLPFMGPPPPPFMNLPPPPFMQSVEMRPAPLGRMMSPTSGRYSPPPPPDRERKRRGGNDYYEQDYEDYEEPDYDDSEEDDYDYDEHDDERERRPRRHSGNGSDNEWRHETYSPPPTNRSYRSQSPTDSRYNYTYETETDLSPPPSPNRGHRRGGTGSYHNYSPRLPATSSPNVVAERTSSSKKSSKGIPNSDSDKSHNSTHHSNKKGKSLV